MEYLEKIAYTEVLLSPTDVNELFGKVSDEKNFLFKSCGGLGGQRFQKKYWCELKSRTIFSFKRNFD